MSELAMEQAPAPSVEARAEELLFGPMKKKAPPPVRPVIEEAPEEAPEQAESDEPVEAQAPTAEELFELEVDGETIAIPAKFKKAVMNERDYTQKSQKNAELARSFEVANEQARIANLRQQFESENAPDIQRIQAYDSVLSQPVDWNSLSTEDAFRRKIQLDQWKSERDDLLRSLQGKHQQWAQKFDHEVSELRKKADEAVVKRVPNWTADTWKSITEHAKSDGYTDAELNNILDPRHKVTLWKAQQFDQLKAKATKTVADVKTVKTSSSNPMPQHVKDKLNFRNQLKKATPGTSAHKSLIEGRIGKIFS